MRSLTGRTREPTHSALSTNFIANWPLQSVSGPVCASGNNAAAAISAAKEWGVVDPRSPRGGAHSPKITARNYYFLYPPAESAAVHCTWRVLLYIFECICMDLLRFQCATLARCGGRRLRGSNRSRWVVPTTPRVKKIEPLLRLCVCPPHYSLCFYWRRFRRKCKNH